MSIFFEKVDVKMINERSKNSMIDHLGIEFTEIGKDYLIATMPVNEKTMQPFGIMHGGASCALAETVASAAANFCIDRKKQVCVGLEINVNHIRPVSSGTVKAITTPDHIGKKTQVWQIKIFNEEEKLVSISRITLAVVSHTDIKK